MKKLCTLVVASSIALSSLNVFAATGENAVISRLESSQIMRSQISQNILGSTDAELREFVASEYGPKALKRLEDAVNNGENLNEVAGEIAVGGSEYRSSFCNVVGGDFGGAMIGIGALVAIGVGLNQMKSKSEIEAQAKTNKDADSLVSTIKNEIVQLKAEGVKDDSYLITTRQEEIKQVNIQRNADIATLDRDINSNQSQGTTLVALGAVAGAIAVPALFCKY
jgi:hypothetical protein